MELVRFVAPLVWRNSPGRQRRESTLSIRVPPFLSPHSRKTFQRSYVVVERLLDVPFPPDSPIILFLHVTAGVLEPLFSPVTLYKSLVRALPPFHPPLFLRVFEIDIGTLINNVPESPCRVPLPSPSPILRESSSASTPRKETLRRRSSSLYNLPRLLLFVNHFPPRSCSTRVDLT